MLLKKTNIEEKLQRLKRKAKSENSILDAVKSILKKDDNHDEKIIKTLNYGKSSNNNSFEFDLLETKNIYHIDQIKSICIDYRYVF